MKTSVVKICLVKDGSVEYQGRIHTAEQAAQCVRVLTNNSADEHMFVLCLDVKNRITSVYEAAKGVSESVMFNAKDLFRTAVLSNASGIIIAHNHPSGDTEPSLEDRKLTRQVKECCKLLGFRFLDSLVVTDSGYKSITD